MSAGIELSKPIRVGDMERAPEFPACMFGLRLASRYTLEHPLTFDTRSLLPRQRATRDLVGQAAHDRGRAHLLAGLSRHQHGRHANSPGPAGLESAASQKGLEYNAGPVTGGESQRKGT